MGKKYYQPLNRTNHEYDSNNTTTKYYLARFPNLFSLLLSTIKNKIGRTPLIVESNWAWYYSEGFYRFFKAQTLIGTFPNSDQIRF
jgi:hypothetical protein